jgi:hypothetical protein
MADYIHELADGVFEVVDRIEAQRVRRDASISGQSALGLLQSIYRDQGLPLSTRMRAAALALPHESPRLTAVANVNVFDFSDRLEKAISRSGAAYLPDKTRSG